jgi:flagellar motility protein MotE (MotC chaperone)
MAKELTPEEAAAQAEKKRLQDEKKQLKNEQKRQKKEAKKRAKEIAKQQDELDDDGESNGFVTFIATVFIVLLWLVVICVVVKLDIGGFGSGVLTPLLQDVPVINRILPGNSLTVTNDPESYGGYSNLQEAVDQIKSLELQLEQAQTSVSAKDEQIATLNAEVERLQEFEQKQVDFQRIRTEFYEEVVYSDKGPGAEEYRKYYEEMDEATAEYLYKQVVTQLEESSEVQEYAETYAEMKPKQAAAAFEKMTDNLTLVAKILNAMNTEDRAKILDAMDSDVVAKLTKIMDPES